MSIVEKAVEKLKAQQPKSSIEGNAAVPSRMAPSMDGDAAAATPRTATTVERLQERKHEAEPVVESPTPPWHVDAGRLKRMGLTPREDRAKRRLADELRRVKRPVLNHTGGKGDTALAHAERIIVTSAVPGEGKTFTAWNLAQSLAREPDFEVLLVDGDIPKADITRALGLEGKPGLMDVLVHEEREPTDVIVRTDVPNLLVVPAGKSHPLAAELFGSHRMQHVLEAWGGGRQRQRLLVFDSAPLLATSESAVLASHMGQVIMIIAAGRTHRQELTSAVQSLDASQYVGLILNMSRLPSSESYYYDGYHSNYYPTSQGEEA